MFQKIDPILFNPKKNSEYFSSLHHIRRYVKIGGTGFEALTLEGWEAIKPAGIQAIARAGYTLNTYKCQFPRTIGNPLTELIERNNYEAAYALIEVGAEVNININGYIPLLQAAEEHSTMFQTLIEKYGADVDFPHIGACFQVKMGIIPFQYWQEHYKYKYPIFPDHY